MRVFTGRMEDIQLFTAQMFAHFQKWHFFQIESMHLELEGQAAGHAGKASGSWHTVTLPQPKPE
jgi:hypothetical protein